MSVSQVIPEPRRTLNRRSHLGGDYGHRSRWWRGRSGQNNTAGERRRTCGRGGPPPFRTGEVRNVRETAQHSQMPWSGYAGVVTDCAGFSDETVAEADDTVSET